VVFDKVKDNQARLGTVRGDTYSTMVNRSLNQVLIRSINTSIVALLPVASLLFVGTYLFGGLALRDFALALFVGLLTGAYSSIFVATPILAWLKEREPRYRALRERAATDLARAGGLAKAAPARSAPAQSAGARVAAPPPEPVDAPIDGDDVEPFEVDDDAADTVTDSGPEPSSGSTYGTTSVPGQPTRGAANPRGRQQRRKKRR
jgi:preprotein translocase subunit SecF